MADWVKSPSSVLTGSPALGCVTPGAAGLLPARLIEGQKTIGWREALTELETACPGRLR